VVPNFASADQHEAGWAGRLHVGMVACTMLFCLASGEFDMSVGSVVACSGVPAAVASTPPRASPWASWPAASVGGLVGLINGMIIAKFKINALITTLATMQIVRGLGYIISDGKAVGISKEGFFVLGNSALLGIPTPVWLMLGCFVLFGCCSTRPPSAATPWPWGATRRPRGWPASTWTAPRSSSSP
jgi:L-arabinose transport system permease protein